MKKIDIHAHYFPPITQDQAAVLDPVNAPWLAISDDGRTGQTMKGSQPFLPVYRALWDPAMPLEEIDRHGVEVQIISSTPIMFGYEYTAPRTHACTANITAMSCA